MKLAAILLLASALVGTLRAETRFILVEVNSSSESPHTANVYSPEKKDRRKDVSIAEAAKALREAPDWKATSGVEIVFHGHRIDCDDLSALVQALKANDSLVLMSVVTAESAEGRAKLKEFMELPR